MNPFLLIGLAGLGAWVLLALLLLSCGAPASASCLGNEIPATAACCVDAQGDGGYFCEDGICDPVCACISPGDVCCGGAGATTCPGWLLSYISLEACCT